MSLSPEKQPERAIFFREAVRDLIAEYELVEDSQSDAATRAIQAIADMLGPHCVVCGHRHGEDRGHKAVT